MDRRERYQEKEEKKLFWRLPDGWEVWLVELGFLLSK